MLLGIYYAIVIEKYDYGAKYYSYWVVIFLIFSY